MKCERFLMAQPDIMTVQEVAELLRVSERTVYDWATNGQIPCGKLGTTWRFKRADIESWIDENLSGYKPAHSPMVSIRDILSPEHVVIFDVTSKRQALQQLIDLLSNNSVVGNTDELAEGIFKREEMMSTGIGLGIAVPHVRLKSIKKPIMAVGISKSNITDYESLDSKPVRILFMILAGKTEHALHIKTMAAISRRIKNPVLREMLLQSGDIQTVYDLLTEGVKS